MTLRFKPVPSPLSEMNLWNARSHGYSFVISQETRSGPSFEGWTGYMASFKPLAGSPMQAQRLCGGPWQTFEEAEAACKATLAMMKRPM